MNRGNNKKKNNIMIIGGIDENGRGSIIGPLVITAFLIEDEKVEELEKIGVKDSKKLEKKEREKIFEKLIEIGKFHQKIISATEINYYLLQKSLNLNELEIIKMAELINETSAEIYYIDAPFNPSKFKRTLSSLIKRNVEIIAEHKLDEKNLVVASASIIGKVIRDREIEKIKSIISFDFGSGYVSDKKTKEFIEKSIRERKDYDFIRKSWITYEDLSKKIKVVKLSKFIKENKL